MSKMKVLCVFVPCFLLVCIHSGAATYFFPTRKLFKGPDSSITYIGPGVCKIDFTMDYENFHSAKSVMNLNTTAMCSVKVTNIFVSGLVYYKNQLLFDERSYKDKCDRPLYEGFTCPIPAWQPIHIGSKASLAHIMTKGSFVVFKDFLSKLPGPLNVTVSGFTYVQGAKVPLGALNAVFNLHKLVNTKE